MSDSEVLDFSPDPRDNRTRSLVVELLVRQAFAGEDWQTKSAQLIEQHKIDPQEIEKELVRRKDRRSGRSEEGAQRRARVLTEVLREMPADAPRDQIVAAFRDRYSQPDRRRAGDGAPEQSTTREAAIAAASVKSDPDSTHGSSEATSASAPSGSVNAETKARSTSETTSPSELSNQETNEGENKKPWWKRVMFWIK